MMNITDDQKSTMLKAARITIAESLGVDHPFGPVTLADPLYDNRYGIFVTLHAGLRLRGCIGHVRGELPLREGLVAMANNAAFHDPRFPALTREEYPEIDIEISVLGPVEKVASVEEIEVGVHGIIISRGYHTGLLLPQVATEQCWDRYTFVQNTCFKAGLQHTAWKEPDTVIEKFTAVVFGEKERGPASSC